MLTPPSRHSQFPSDLQLNGGELEYIFFYYFGSILSLLEAAEIELNSSISVGTPNLLDFPLLHKQHPTQKFSNMIRY